MKGDPLSPFLFILMEECLDRSTKASILDGSLKGLNLYDDHPNSSNLQFFEDNMIMGDTSAR